MLQQELRVARGVPASRPSQAPPQIEHPRKVGNLQVAMGLKDNYLKFQQFQVSHFFFVLHGALWLNHILQCDIGDFALRAGLDYRCRWRD